MEKSADAFRTISEVAEDLGLPQHVLRFWESRFPQIRPLKRAGGRRYYRRTDVELLRAIRQFLYDDGYTIKGVQRLLKDRGAKAVLADGRHDESDPPDPEVLPIDPEDSVQSAAGWEPDGRWSSADAACDPDRAKALAAALAAVEDCERILKAAQAPSA